MAFDLGEATLLLKVSTQQLIDGLKEGEDAAKDSVGKHETFAEKIDKSWEEAFNLTKIAAGMLAVEGFKKLVEAANQMVEAFAEDEKAEIRLNSALNTTATGVPHNTETILALVDSFSLLTGVSREVSSGMITLLASTGRTDDQIKDMLTAANSLSNATGIDLNTALTQLDATFAGNIGRLGRLTPELKDLTVEQLKNGAAVDMLLEKYGSMKDVLANSADVSIKNFKNQWEEVGAQIGRFINETMQPLRDALTIVATKMNEHAAAIHLVGVAFKDVWLLGESFVLLITNAFVGIPAMALTIKKIFGDVSSELDKNTATYREVISLQAAAHARAVANAEAIAGLAKKRIDDDIAAKKAAEDLATTTLAMSNRVTENYGLNYEAQYKSYEKSLQDKAKAQKKAADDEAKATKELIDFDNKQIADAALAIEKIAKDKEAYETKNAKDGAALREQLLLDARQTAIATMKAADATETANAKTAADLRNKLLIDADNERLAMEKAAREKAAQEELARQNFVKDAAISVAKAISEELGKELLAGKLSWKSLGEAAVHAIGRIISAIGDNLAAAAAADTIKAIAAIASIVGAAAAPGFFAAAGIESGGAVAAWATGAALSAVSFSEGADFIVPPGYNNDTFPMRVESGEHVQVTPAGQSSGSDIPQQVSISLDGAVFAKWLQKASKNQEIIIHAGAIVR